MSDQVIKLIIDGRINGKDIKYMRQLIDENNLQSIDLTDAKVSSGGGYYYSSYDTITWATAASRASENLQV